MKVPIAPLNSMLGIPMIWRTWISQLTDFLSSLLAVYNTIEQQTIAANYPIVLLDSGKQIYHSAAGAVTVTIPANASTAFPIGTQLFFINNSGAGVMSIAITTDTLLFSPSGGTGTRSLAASGFAHAIKITSTRWIIYGSGLT